MSSWCCVLCNRVRSFEKNIMINYKPIFVDIIAKCSELSICRDKCTITSMSDTLNPKKYVIHSRRLMRTTKQVLKIKVYFNMVN